MNKALRRLIGTVVGSVALAATCASAQTVLNVNTALTTDDPMYLGLERMKAAVEKRSAGKLQVRVFPGSQLGKDEDLGKCHRLTPGRPPRAWLGRWGGGPRRGRARQ